MPNIREKLLAQKEQQKEDKRVCGDCYSKEYEGYVFVDAMGNLFNPKTLSAVFSRLLEKAGLRHIRFHDLRHSCASLLLANDVPMKQIQEWLGHSDIWQIMTSKSPVRSAEDVDEQALSYAEIKALCTGNPHIKEKMDLDIDVALLKLLKANHLSERYALEDHIIHHYPAQIRALEQKAEGYTCDIQRVQVSSHPNEEGFCPTEIESTVHTEKKAAGSAILEACKAIQNSEPVSLGQYRGFEMELCFDSIFREYKITLIGALRHQVFLGSDVYGNIQRLDNALEGLPVSLTKTQEAIKSAQQNLDQAKAELNKPFPFEKELATKSARLGELNAMLDMDKPENEIVDGERSEDDVTPLQSKTWNAEITKKGCYKQKHLFVAALIRSCVVSICQK